MSRSQHRPSGVALGSREALRAAIDARRQAAATTRLAPRENRSALPLSFVQERLWLLQRLDPSLAAYNRCPAVRLRGPLEEARLARALNRVAATYDVLRAGFQDRGGRPVQFVRNRVDMTPHVVDLTARIDTSPEDAVREAARAVVARPFDLARDELVRPVLFRLAADDHVLLLVVHHTISDGWSDNIFLRLLGRAYDTDGPLPVPLLQYVDFAAHQRAWFEGTQARRMLARVVERLSGYPHVITLPTTRARPPVQPTSGARVSMGDARLLKQLTAAAAMRAGTTPFAVLLATFQVLLARLSGQERFVVGVPVAGRTRLEVEDMLGCFANTVVIPADVSDGCDFLAHVRRVQESTIDALDCQELPFEQVVNAIQPARDLSRAPLYQVLFGLHNTPSASVEFGRLTVSRFPLHGNTSQVDLNLTIAETENGLEGAFEYAVPLFDSPTVEAWRDHFLCLLAELPRSSGSVLRAPLWTRRHYALVGRRNVDRRPSRPGSIDERIHRCIERRPDRIAMTWDGGTLTYRDIDRRAAAFAAALRDAGVGRGDRVGIFMERSSAMVAAMLGVWRLGAAYVPFDPECPPARAEYMLQDSRVSVTITDRSTAAHERVRVGAALFVDDIAADGVVTDVPGVSAADTAYLIYTSGSTGAPKGVPVTHGSLDNLLSSMAERPGFGEADRMLALTTIAFDIAALELFLPLIVGGSIALAGAQAAADPRALIGLVDRDRPTVMQATPSTWRMLLDAGWRGDRSIKALCGGEALPPVLARDLLDVVGELWNVYGPTETTIWSTAARVTPGRNPALLGAPVANTGIFVLDRHLAPSAVMATGELCISGAGLSDAYWCRADLTAERFVSAVLDGQETRVYRTGDLARYRADGEVELLGRVDHQVKIRGHRIELGEIEARLLRLPYIGEAVVTVAGAPPHQRLVAFVATREGARPTIESVRADAAAWLPDYMLPAQLVLLPAIPKTQNGKVDRAALPDPARATDARPPASMTALQQAIARIWASILDVNELHPSDSFFSVGGNSLLATRVAARLQEQLGIDVPLRALFERPTIAGMASIIEDGLRDTTSQLIADARWAVAVPVAPRASAGEAVVVTGGTGFVGAFVAARLFEHDDRIVRLPIRARSEAEALERFVATLQRYELWRDDWRRRVEVRAIDLVEVASADGKDLDRLFAGVDACYHCAASVNFLMPYAALRPANVEATSALLRAAAAAGSAFHYVSTMYVCDAAAAGDGPVGENAALTNPEQLRGGYPQSKWVAEQRVRQCLSEGLPGSIHRLGRVGGAGVSGAVSPADFLWQLVRAAVVLGAFPEIDACVDLLAVDTAAEAIVALSRREGPAVFHVASSSGVHLSAVSQWLQGAGYRLQLVPYRTWRTSVQRERDDAVAALASLLPEDPLASPMLNANDRFDNRRTADQLQAVDVSCPPVSGQTFLRSVRYLSAQGVLPAPTGENAGG